MALTKILVSLLHPVTLHLELRTVRQEGTVCTYCKGWHTANQCNVVKDHQQCTSIVKIAGLHFNYWAVHVAVHLL